MLQKKKDIAGMSRLWNIKEEERQHRNENTARLIKEERQHRNEELQDITEKERQHKN